jgi:hypothetical protein
MTYTSHRRVIVGGVAVKDRDDHSWAISRTLTTDQWNKHKELHCNKCGVTYDVVKTHDEWDALEVSGIYQAIPKDAILPACDQYIIYRIMSS